MPRPSVNLLICADAGESRTWQGRRREPGDEALISPVPYGGNRGCLGVSSSEPRTPQIPLEVLRHTRLGRRPRAARAIGRYRLLRPATPSPAATPDER